MPCLKTSSPSSLEIDVADGDRAGLAAGDRGIRRVLEPVALLQPVDDAAVEIGDVAGDALDLRILDRLDDDVVAEPVDADLADLLGVPERPQQPWRTQWRTDADVLMDPSPESRTPTWQWCESLADASAASWLFVDNGGQAIRMHETDRVDACIHRRKGHPWRGASRRRHRARLRLWIDKGAGIFMATVEAGWPGASEARLHNMTGYHSLMMRSILVGILVLMAAGVGFMTFEWYRERNSGEAYGAPFTLVDQKGAPITEAAFRGHPSAVFFGFTHCPEVCPTTLFETGRLAEEARRRGQGHPRLFRLRRSRARHAGGHGAYVGNVSDRITGITGEPDKIAAMAKAFGIYSRRCDSRAATTRWTTPPRSCCSTARATSPAPSPMARTPTRRIAKLQAPRGGGLTRRSDARQTRFYVHARTRERRARSSPRSRPPSRKTASRSPCCEIDEDGRHPRNLALCRRRADERRGRASQALARRLASSRDRARSAARHRLGGAVAGRAEAGARRPLSRPRRA